jgi:hypothetical protein
MGEVRNACIVLVAKPQGKRLLRKHRHKEEETKMHLRQREWECGDWIHLAQDRVQLQVLVNMVMILQVP